MCGILLEPQKTSPIQPCLASGPHVWVPMQKWQQWESLRQNAVQAYLQYWRPPPQRGEASSVCDIGKPQQGNP